MTAPLAFFMAFVRHPLQVGSIIPSSQYLLRRIVDVAGISTATTIIELGPGNGVSTQAILRAACPDARLLSIELNPELHKLIRGINDKRLIAHLGDARQLKNILALYGIGAADVLISGIPFSTMSMQSGSQLLMDITSVLSPGGRFVAYQVSKRVATLARPFMGEGHQEVVLFNTPPMRLYRWVKSERH